MSLGAPTQPSGPPGPRRMRAVGAALSLVVPPCCAACRVPVLRQSVLCDTCRDALPVLRRPCPWCALPAHRGRPCPAARSAFDSAWAPFAHSGPARDVVLGLKVAGRLPLAAWMAGQLALGLEERCAGALGGAVVVPVPAAPGRRRRRGFDPAALLAEGLAESIAVEVAPVLRRRDRAARQVGAGRHARRAAGRIRVEAIEAPPRQALLLDDVHTTGSTLDACARALKAAGCERVRAVTFARSLRASDASACTVPGGG